MVPAAGAAARRRQISRPCMQRLRAEIAAPEPFVHGRSFTSKRRRFRCVGDAVSFSPCASPAESSAVAVLAVACASRQPAIFRITPVRLVEELRREALAAQPEETGSAQDSSSW